MSDGRQAGDAGNIGARLQLPAVAHEVFDEVAAVLEGIHDVGELVGVPQPERVAQLVDAGQVDDGVAQERIEAGLPGDVRPSDLMSGRM